MNANNVSGPDKLICFIEKFESERFQTSLASETALDVADAIQPYNRKLAISLQEFNIQYKSVMEDPEKIKDLNSRRYLVVRLDSLIHDLNTVKTKIRSSDWNKKAGKEALLLGLFAKQFPPSK